MDAPIRFPCPNPACGKQLRTDPDKVGKRVRCSCGQVLVVPRHPGSGERPGRREQGTAGSPETRATVGGAGTPTAAQEKPPEAPPLAESPEDTSARNFFALMYGIPAVPGLMFVGFGIEQGRLGLAAVGACLLVFSAVGALSLFVTRKRASVFANVFTVIGAPLGAAAGFVFALLSPEGVGEGGLVKGLVVGALAGGGALRPLGWLIGLCAGDAGGDREAAKPSAAPDSGPQ